MSEQELREEMATMAEQRSIRELRDDLQRLDQWATPQKPEGMEEHDPAYTLSVALDELAALRDAVLAPSDGEA